MTINETKQLIITKTNTVINNTNTDNNTMNHEKQGQRKCQYFFLSFTNNLISKTKMSNKCQKWKNNSQHNAYQDVKCQ